MSFWKSFFNSTEREQVVIPKGWRVGMWVMSPDQRQGIIYKIGETCEVHIVDTSTGETKESLSCPLGGLRQLKWAEIPECRRGITKEQGEALGYGS